MSVHEQLSRLLDGDLDESEEQDLRRRIEDDPEVAAAWQAMQRLPDELAALPDVPPPPALDRAVLSPGSPDVQRFSRRWAPWAAAAACLVLIWMWTRPGPPLVLVQGSQFVQGHALVLAGATEVEVAGRALIEVEPPDAFLREGTQEVADMNKTHLLAALAGAIVTVSVYEGSAVLRAAEAEPVTVLPGETWSTAPEPVAAAEPEEARVVRVQVPEGSDPAQREQVLVDEIGRLRAELEAAKLGRDLTRGQLETHQGTPQPWPDDLPDVYRQDAFEAAVEEALKEQPFGDLEVLDCSEFPCFAVIRSHEVGDDWQDDVDAFAQLLRDATEGEHTGVIAHLSGMNRNGDELRYAGVAVGPDRMGEDPDMMQRADFRIRSAVEGLVEDATPSEQDVEVR